MKKIRMTEEDMKAEFRKEPLGGGLAAVVSREHTFGTDAVLLAAFAAPKATEVCCDLGTGCGIIPLLWCRAPAPNVIHGVELQRQACEQAEQAIALNHLENRFFIHKGDLRQVEALLKPFSCGLVTMNPPYKPVHTGIESKSEAEKIARHELCCAIEDAVQAADKLLNFGGRFCICHRPERLCDVLHAFRRFHLEPKKIRFAADRLGQEPFLFLLEGRKGGKPGLRVLPELYLREENGAYTREMWELYGQYAEGRER